MSLTVLLDKYRRFHTRRNIFDFPCLATGHMLEYW